MDCLLRERTIALGNTIEPATLRTYNSALTSYLTFIRAHNLPTSPSEDTLSFYVVYMSHHISPRSVTTYLSGIVQQLEPFYPMIRDIRNSKLVQRTLHGCLKSFAQPKHCKRALTISDLTTILTHFNNTPPTHDNLLFLSMLFTGFFSLMRLGEMAFPDDKTIQDWRKISWCRTVTLQQENYSFQLPFHKADRFFTGNTILVTRSESVINPVLHFRAYLASHDSLMPFHLALWLRANGSIPTRSFFMRRLRLLFDKEIGGQSMRAGGATFLAEKGVSPSLIQAHGRWSSDAFLIYIRKNPALLIDLITARN